MENKGQEKSSLRVLEASPEDAEAIVKIQLQTWLDTYPNEQIGITAEMIEKRFSNVDERVSKWRDIIESQSSKVWVARQGEKTVGFCGVREEGAQNRLASIYVDPNCQGGGVGRALIEQAISYLGRGKDITLDVASYNDAAINFYKNNGFEILNDVPEEDLLKIGEVKLPETRMILRAEGW